MYSLEDLVQLQFCDLTEYYRKAREIENEIVSIADNLDLLFLRKRKELQSKKGKGKQNRPTRNVETIDTVANDNEMTAAESEKSNEMSKTLTRKRTDKNKKPDTQHLIRPTTSNLLDITTTSEVENSQMCEQTGMTLDDLSELSKFNLTDGMELALSVRPSRKARENARKRIEECVDCLNNKPKNSKKKKNESTVTTTTATVNIKGKKNRNKIDKPHSLTVNNINDGITAETNQLLPNKPTNSLEINDGITAETNQLLPNKPTNSLEINDGITAETNQLLPNRPTNSLEINDGITAEANQLLPNRPTNSLQINDGTFVMKDKKFDTRDSSTDFHSRNDITIQSASCTLIEPIEGLKLNDGTFVVGGKTVDMPTSSTTINDNELTKELTLNDEKVDNPATLIINNNSENDEDVIRESIPRESQSENLSKFKKCKVRLTRLQTKKMSENEKTELDGEHKQRKSSRISSYNVDEMKENNEPNDEAKNNSNAMKQFVSPTEQRKSSRKISLNKSMDVNYTQMFNQNGSTPLPSSTPTPPVVDVHEVTQTTIEQQHPQTVNTDVTQCLDVTHVVGEQNKRTKPVVKSTLFDADGNRLMLCPLPIEKVTNEVGLNEEKSVAKPPLGITPTERITRSKMAKNSMKAIPKVLELAAVKKRLSNTKPISTKTHIDEREEYEVSKNCLSVTKRALLSSSKYRTLLTQSTTKKVLVNSSSKSAVKPNPSTVDDVIKDEKFQLKMIKENEAVKKNKSTLKMKQNELKRKNELKLKAIAERREQIEKEKQAQILLLEKQKKEKQQMLQREREQQKKEELLKKKNLAMQKMAEAEERRKQEALARSAYLKEKEAEEKRIAREQQEERERVEKKAQERAKEEESRRLAKEMERKMRIEAQKAKIEKSKKMKHRSYKARNENDRGIEDEISDDEDDLHRRTDLPIPAWARGENLAKLVENQKKIRKCCPDALDKYFEFKETTVDLVKLFDMTPTRANKRTSSAVWTVTPEGVKSLKQDFAALT